MVTPQGRNVKALTSPSAWLLGARLLRLQRVTRVVLLHPAPQLSPPLPSKCQPLFLPQLHSLLPTSLGSALPSLQTFQGCWFSDLEPLPLTSSFLPAPPPPPHTPFTLTLLFLKPSHADSLGGKCGIPAVLSFNHYHPKLGLCTMPDSLRIC